MVMREKVWEILGAKSIAKTIDEPEKTEEAALTVN